MTSVIAFVIMVDWLHCETNSQTLLGGDDIILHEKRKRKGAWSYRLSSYSLQSCLQPQGTVSKLQGSVSYMPLQKTGESLMYLLLQKLCSCIKLLQ